jgi:hypothetical protein
VSDRDVDIAVELAKAAMAMTWRTMMRIEESALRDFIAERIPETGPNGDYVAGCLK